jgi:RND superfamily putative drug exporter
MSSVLNRIAAFSARRRTLVLLAWLAALVGLGLAAHAAGTTYTSTVEVPGSDSQAATDVMSRSFSSELTDSSPIVFHTDSGTLTDAEHRPVVEESLQALSASPEVQGATDPLEDGSAALSADGRTAYSTVVPAHALGDLSEAEAERILDAAAEPAEGTGVQVEAGGQLGAKLSKPETHTSELIGVGAAVLILVAVFGTITAMALPIVVAVFSLACGLSVLTLFGHVAAVPDVAPTLATMIGLGVGIDYSLFIVTRMRAARQDGMGVREAIGFAAATSGAAVAFAGGTVIIALLALAVSGLTFVTMLGQAAAIVVAITLLAAVTLLPALLSLAGDRVERGRIGRDKRPTLGHSRFWEGWGRRLVRRPGLFAVVSVAGLLALAAPVTGLELGLTDNSSSPESTTVRQGYDLLTDGFGAGANGPLLVTADADGADELAKQLSTVDGVTAVSPPQVSEDGTAALINVVPAGSPSSDVTRDVVGAVRDEVIPQSGVEAHVGGSTAQQLDLADRIGERLPLIIATVVALSMVLLLVAFRSVLVPLQAALVNLLAVGAAYGIVTAIFQDGHGATALGLDGAIPIVSYVPMMMFAILFGLAMDYQVFLLSRVREELDAGRSARDAVIAGLAGTGKVIASAAAIMVAVFASFILNGDPTIKEFGVGLSSAILIAGAMVCVLLPAVMLLCGRRTWWLPRRLDRVLPHISVEGPQGPADAALEPNPA